MRLIAALLVLASCGSEEGACKKRVYCTNDSTSDAGTPNEAVCVEKKCGSQNQSYQSCMASKITCTADKKTDTASYIEASRACSMEEAAYVACVTR